MFPPHLFSILFVLRMIDSSSSRTTYFVRMHTWPHQGQLSSQHWTVSGRSVGRRGDLPLHPPARGDDSRGLHPPTPVVVSSRLLLFYFIFIISSIGSPLRAFLPDNSYFLGGFWQKNVFTIQQ